MDYFVSVDNSVFNRWQLELLIESFKFYELEDSLSVALSDVNENGLQIFDKNLKNHKRKVTYADYGAIRGYKPLNFLYNLYFAVRDGVVAQPFYCLSPDVVLKKIPQTEF